MLKLVKLSLKKLVLQSPFLKGVSRRDSNENFPVSPTLLNFINVSEKTRELYNQKRKQLLDAKNDESIIYDKRLRPYQNADVNFLTKISTGKGVFNQQRIGKTPVTLVTMREKNQQKNLIIVPKSLIYKWKAEYKKWHGGKVATMRWWWPKKRRVRFYKETFLNVDTTIIVNYKKIVIDFDEIVCHLGPFSSIVLDEAHVLRNYRGHGFSYKRKKVKGKYVEYKSYVSSATARKIIDMRQFALDAYALTGTPAPNAPQDIFGILAFLHNELFTSFWGYADYYMKTIKRNQWNPTSNRLESIDELIGFQSIEKEKEFIEFLEIFSIQRRRKDVMKWLPKVDRETVFVEPSPKTITRMTELKEYYETEHVICPTPLSVFTRLRQLAVSPKLLGFKEVGAKFEYILDYIKTYPNKPLIISSWFKEGLFILKEYLESNKINKIVVITGDTTPKDRFLAEKNFQEGKYNIILGQIKVIAEGFTFSRAEEIINIDPSLTQSDNEQVGDRFLPVNKVEALAKEGQLIKHLRTSKSIDIYIASRLKKKYNDTRIVNEYLEHLQKLKGELDDESL